MADIAQSILSGIEFCLAQVGHVLGSALLLAAAYPLAATALTIAGVYLLSQLRRR